MQETSLSVRQHLPHAALQVQRIRHEIRLRELQVVRVDAITAHFKSITFAGSALAGFVSASFDDHVKLIFPGSPDGPVRRDFTPRRYDAQNGELSIEFSLHGDGVASRWAEQARPGDGLTIAGPKGSMVMPLVCDWHLLAGDETALPAIARRLEELPASASATVIVQTNSAADRRPLPSAAAVALHWVASGAELLETLRALPRPVGAGFAWCAGEAGWVAASRDILVNEKGVDRHAVRASAYWKRGTPHFHEEQ